MPSGLFWSKEETEFLKKNEVSDASLSHLLNRSIGSIRQKRACLGIRKKEVWTKEKISEAIQLHEKGMNMAEIAEKLGTKKNRVYVILSKEGAINSWGYKKWSEQDIEHLKKYFDEGISIIKIAELLNRQRNSIVAKIKGLNLKREYNYSRRLSGQEGERKAEEMFKKLGWKPEKPKNNLPHDFIIKRDEEKIYINVKHGKEFAIRAKNIENLLKFDGKKGFVLIDDDKFYFLPIIVLNTKDFNDEIFKIDLDTRIDKFGWLDDYKKMVADIMQRFGYSVNRIISRASPSGRGLHIWIHVKGPEIKDERIRNKLQMFCGDDNTRVWINQMRIEKGIPLWSKMFSKVIWKRPNDPKYLMRMKKRQLVDMYVKLSEAVRSM